jgi:flagellar protein FlgJ
MDSFTGDLGIGKSRIPLAQKTSELERLDRLKRQTETLKDANSAKDAKRLKEACQDFEAIFIKQMLDGMRKTVPRAELLERTLGEEIFEDILYTEYAKIMSRRGSLGIADLLFKQLFSPSIQNE